MTARRTSRALARALALLSLAAPVTAVVVAATVPAADAAAAITSPSAGAIITSGSTVTATGTAPVCSVGALQTCPNAVLTLTDSNGSTRNSSKQESRSSSVALSVSLPSGDGTLPNAAWSVTLTESGKNVANPVTFYTNFGPTAAPTGLTAQATSPAPGESTGSVALSWSYAGAEPQRDKAGFLVEDGAGGSKTVGPDVCSGGTCSTTLTYDNPTPGTYDYTFTVKALRSSCRAAGCSTADATLASAASGSASAQLVTPEPPPSPTPAPSESSSPGSGTSAGTTGGGTTGSTGGGTTGSTQAAGGKQGSGSTTGSPIIVPTLNPLVAQRKAFALSFNSFSPSLGIPKLPPLPATTFSETVGGGPESYQPTLPYKAQQAHSTTSVLTSPLAAVGNLDTAQLAKSLAAALILLVAAAHVRVFVKSHQAD